MPQSHSCIYIHAIFSTKHREPSITERIAPKLHAYLAESLHSQECPAIVVGGMPDHVHVLFRLHRTKSISEMVECIKRSSSKWIKTQGSEYGGFHWQSGYGAFSVGGSQVDQVRRYVENQREHHRVRGFQEEYRMFMNKYGIEWDEQYVWD